MTSVSTSTGVPQPLAATDSPTFAGSTLTGQLLVTLTTEQMRLRYDATKYMTVTVNSDGHVDLDSVGAGAKFDFNVGGTQELRIQPNSIATFTQYGGFFCTTASYVAGRVRFGVGVAADAGEGLTDGGAAGTLGFAIAGAEKATLTAALFSSLVPVKVPTYTVATLPSAATVGSGSHAMVSDSNLSLTGANIGATVAGGGSYIVPVVSNGTNWLIGG